MGYKQFNGEKEEEEDDHTSFIHHYLRIKMFYSLLVRAFLPLVFSTLSYTMLDKYIAVHMRHVKRHAHHIALSDKTIRKLMVFHTVQQLLVKSAQGQKKK